MLRMPMRICLPTLRVAACAAVLALAGAAQGQSSGPFDRLAGNWAGSGNINIGNGTKERIRCRAQYDVRGGGTFVRIALRCASDSYKFELQSDANYQNGRVIGNWNEKTRGAAGRLSGGIKGDRIDVQVDGQSFSAVLALTTRGEKQSISITAPLGSEMAEASITLNRS